MIHPTLQPGRSALTYVSALPLFLFVSAIAGTISFSHLEAAEQSTWKLDFGGDVASGYAGLRPGVVFTPETGFGFEPGAAVAAIAGGGGDPLHDGCVASDKPFAVSVAVPEGVYRVRVILGDARGDSTTTIKAEARRLMVEKAETAPGKFETRTFAVAVKRPELKNGGTVKLKLPEQDGHRDWDSKLTIEFSNRRPCLCALEIEPAEGVKTIYIAGDSTVTNQPHEPYVGWGQALPRFFTGAVAISNHAQSGESLSTSLGAKRFAKIFENIQPGEYLLLQFGHNDQKEKRPGAGAFTTYKDRLRSVVQATKKRGAIPVIVTSMERRRFEGDHIAPTLTEYAEAAAQVSREEGIPLIDLHAMSIRFFETLGPEKSVKASIHFPAGTFPGQKQELRDDSHFSIYGAYELARCVVEGMRAAKLDVVKFLAPDVKAFDPAHPDEPEAIAIPASPLDEAKKPEGS